MCTVRDKWVIPGAHTHQGWRWRAQVPTLLMVLSGVSRGQDPSSCTAHTPGTHHFSGPRCVNTLPALLGPKPKNKQRPPHHPMVAQEHSPSGQLFPQRLKEKHFFACQPTDPHSRLCPPGPSPTCSLLEAGCLWSVLPSLLLPTHFLHGHSAS